MSQLSIGMIGTGFISQFHAKALENIRQFDFTGIFGTNKSSSSELANWASEHLDKTPKIYDSVKELVQNVDVIALNVPNFARIEVFEEIVRAVKDGAELKGLICEKPLGRNLEEARRMVELAKEIAVPTAYLENQIHMKAIQVQKEQLRPQEEIMGPLTLARSAEEHGGPHSAWFWDPTRQGGGVLLDMGCHSIAVGWYVLTPHGMPLTFLQPQSVSCDLGLLKWGQPKWSAKLKEQYGVNFRETPAEDFATGIVTFKNPETGQLVKAQFTDSWMFEKQGLRLFMDGTGPGYAFELNTLVSPLSIFIGDDAAEAIADSETALEKATASRGLLSTQYNESDLYGYTDELKDAAIAFKKGEDALLDFDYGLEVTKLVMASYMSAERKCTIDLTDPAIQEELETFVPMIQKGQGKEFFNL